MLRRVLRYATQVRLEYVVAVQEGHLAIRFYPNLHPG